MPEILQPPENPEEYEKLSPQEIIHSFKFPRLHHIFPESPRSKDDVLANSEQVKHFLELFNKGYGVITEKLEGSNIGISFDFEGKLQLRHRGGFCSPREKIYKNAFQWVESKIDILKDFLDKESILFIEWLEFNKGFIEYDNLPDYAVTISLFNAAEGKNGKFMSHQFIKELFKGSGILVAPEISLLKPIKSAKDLENCMKDNSVFSTRSLKEGLILRIDIGDFNEQMMKFVDPKFTKFVQESDDHWTKQPLKRNIINYKKQARLLDL